MIRVVLPQHLRTLAHVGGEVQLQVEGAVTQRAVLDALEARYPMLRGTIRDQVTHQRRAFLRFFACQEDLSHESVDFVLPERRGERARSRLDDRRVRSREAKPLSPPAASETAPAPSVRGAAAAHRAPC